MGPAEQEAAEKAACHADTPTIAFFDTLGRIFLGIGDNGTDRKYRTHTILDIEGNHRAVVDALDRVVIRCAFDMGGVQLHETSMEASEHWLLKDVAGRPVRSWNSRRYEVRSEYDALRRPIRTFVPRWRPLRAQRPADCRGNSFRADRLRRQRRRRAQRAPAASGKSARQTLPTFRHGRDRHHRPLRFQGQFAPQRAAIRPQLPQPARLVPHSGRGGGAICRRRHLRRAQPQGYSHRPRRQRLLRRIQRDGPLANDRRHAARGRARQQETADAVRSRYRLQRQKPAYLRPIRQ